MNEKSIIWHPSVAIGSRRPARGVAHAVAAINRSIIVEEPAVWVFLGTGAGPGAAGEGSPVVGQAELSRSTLKLSTNSRERADALRTRVEAACGDRLRHRGREHADPLSSKMLAAQGNLLDELPSSEEEAVIRFFRQRHYSQAPRRSISPRSGASCGWSSALIRVGSRLENSLANRESIPIIQI